MVTIDEVYKGSVNASLIRVSEIFGMLPIQLAQLVLKYSKVIEKKRIFEFISIRRELNGQI